MMWDKMKKIKNECGIGFKDLQCFNLVMIAKTCWTLIKKPGSLLALVMRHNYFQNSMFCDARLGSKSSWWWKGLIQARKVSDKGLRWRVGDGRNIRICEDPWVPRSTTFKVYAKGILPITHVQELIHADGRHGMKS